MPTKKKPLTYKEWQVQKKAIWESMNGCNCPVSYKLPDGRTHVLTARERCSKSTIRCNGRLKVWAKRRKKLGEMPSTKAKAA